MGAQKSQHESVASRAAEEAPGRDVRSGGGGAESGRGSDKQYFANKKVTVPMPVSLNSYFCASSFASCNWLFVPTLAVCSRGWDKRPML